MYSAGQASPNAASVQAIKNKVQHIADSRCIAYRGLTRVALDSQPDHAILLSRYYSGPSLDCTKAHKALS